MKNLALSLVLIMMSAQAAAEVTIELRVSATVAPRSCDVSEPCESDMQKAASADTRVVVEEDRIRYVGPRPEVTEDDGLTTLLF